MPVPYYGADQTDQNPNNVSLGSGTSGLGLDTNPDETALLGVGAGDPTDYWHNYFMQQAMSGRAGIGLDLTNTSQDRTQQDQLIQDLQRSAAGDPNSYAQQQLKQGYGAAQAQQSSIGSTARSSAGFGQMRNVLAGQQQIGMGLAGDQKMLMTQEQQAAQAMLAQYLAQQQQQDIGQAQGMADATLGSQGLDDAMRQFYLGGAQKRDLAATDQLNQVARARMGYQDAQAALTTGLVNSGVQAAGTGLATWSNMGGKGGGNNDGSGGGPTNPWS